MRHQEKHRVKSRISCAVADDPIALLELLPIPLAFWDAARSACLINASTSRLIGFSQAEILDNPQLWNQQVQSDDFTSFYNFHKRAPLDHRETTCDYRFLPKNSGTAIWLRETTMPLAISSSTWRSLSTFINITDLKKAPCKVEQELAGEVNYKIIRDLFHDIKNRLQRLNMEIELTGLEGHLETELGRKFTDAILAVNQSVTAMHDRFLGIKSDDSGDWH